MARMWLEDKNGFVYLERIYLIKAKSIEIFLHKIHVEDLGQDLHNLPWKLVLCIPVLGQYLQEHLLEEGNTSSERISWRNWNFLKETDYHRIDSLSRKPVLSLCVGLRRDTSREWGFLVGERHIPHSEYFGPYQDWKVQ